MDLIKTMAAKRVKVRDPEWALGPTRCSGVHVRNGDTYSPTIHQADQM